MVVQTMISGSALFFQIQCQALIPGQSPASTSCIDGSWSSYGGTKRWRWSELWGRRMAGYGKLQMAGERTRRCNPGSMLCVKAEGFNMWEILGGRGLKGGEKAVNTDEGLEELFSEPVGSGKKDKERGEGWVEIPVSDGFSKEMSGLVGGFPGGEKGLGKFLQDYPPPKKKEAASKASQELEKLREAIAGPAMKAKTIAPPLLMPGMTVLVKEPRNPYYNFTGIVQRITDGRAGVLFEGGNWDKLVTFKLVDLERSAGGPPGSHPKSAILLQQQTPASSP